VFSAPSSLRLLDGLGLAPIRSRCLRAPAREEVQGLFGGTVRFDGVGDDGQAAVSGEGEGFAGEFETWGIT
jgi:hypothetical protein